MVRGWDQDTKYLAMYILTSPHNNMLGCYVLPKLYACDDLGWTLETLSIPFAILLQHGFIQYDENTRLVLIPAFLNHNPIHNEKQGKGAAKVITELPKSPLLSDLKRYVIRNDIPYRDGIVNAIDSSVSRKPYDVSRIPPVVPQGGHDNVSEQPAAGKRKNRRLPSYSPVFLEAKAAYPKRDGDQNYPGAWEGWQDYLGQTHNGQIIAEQDLLRSCRNYHTACKAAGNVGTAFVMQMSTFFGRDARFLEYVAEDWKLDRGPATCGTCTRGGPAPRYCLEVDKTVEPTRKACPKYQEAPIA